jgi:hypothetical protein
MPNPPESVLSGVCSKSSNQKQRQKWQQRLSCNEWSKHWPGNLYRATVGELSTKVVVYRFLQLPLFTILH